MAPCPFCQIVRGFAEAKGYTTLEYRDYPDVATFVPLDPVVDGHLLFVPVRHIEDAAHDHVLAGRVFAAAAGYAAGLTTRIPFNLIASTGAAATQSIYHLHVHYVPRRPGDALHLPWTVTDG